MVALADIACTILFKLFSVDIFPVTDLYDKNHESVVVYFVNNPIVSDPDSVEFFAC